VNGRAYDSSREVLSPTFPSAGQCAVWPYRSRRSGRSRTSLKRVLPAAHVAVHSREPDTALD
jgi:hypothetical protein